MRSYVELRISATTKRERDRAIRELEQLLGSRFLVSHQPGTTAHIGGAQRWTAWCRLETSEGDVWGTRRHRAEEITTEGDHDGLSTEYRPRDRAGDREEHQAGRTEGEDESRRDALAGDDQDRARQQPERAHASGRVGCCAWREANTEAEHEAPLRSRRAGPRGHP